MLLEYSVETPLNREPPPTQLIETFITKSSVAYDRNHGPIPHINEETHYVRIDGAVDRVVELSVKELREDFEQHEVVSSLQCAGNRRHTMRTEFKEVNGIDWFSGALMNGTWRGPLLRDVLLKAGVAIKGDAHVALSCHKTLVQDDWYYGGSIELSRVMDPEKSIILALELNGKTLSINHGFPVRAVLPGIAGARWVKWLDRVTVQRSESNNYYQQQDYKILPPHVETKEQAMENWHLVPAMQLMPINSVICTPASEDVIKPDSEGKVVVAGYAVPAGDDGPVTKVDISLDRGKTWRQTDIVQETPTKWSWALWRTKVDMHDLLPGEGDQESSRRIWCRAHDKGGNVQDDSCQWNYRGVGYNSYGEVKNLVINVPPSQPTDKELVNGVAKLAIGAAA